MPLGQKRAVWIRTSNLSLRKRTTLTTEPRLHIWDNISWNIAVFIVELQKRKLQLTKHVGTRCRCSPTLVQSLAAKMGLGDINEICLQGPNLSSSQKWAFHHDSVLLQPAMNAEEFLSLRKWEHKHSGMIAFPQLTPFWHQDGVRKLLELIAEHAQLFEHHFCDSKISRVTECFLVEASAFFNLSVSLKYF